MKIDFRELQFNNAVRDITKVIAKKSIKLHNFLKTNATSDLSTTEIVNIQGEKVHEVDQFANELFLQGLLKCSEVKSVISEEMVEEVFNHHKQGRYTVAIDPLDGSSNVGVNIPTGTVFGIYHKNNRHHSGKFLLAAGYIIYGCNTEMVLSDGKKTVLYRLKKKKFQRVKTLVLDESKLIYYSINDSLLADSSTEVQHIIAECKSKNMSARYVGSFVADMHRNLQKGGVFIYPATAKNPDGKLRYLYEVAPMAMIAKGVGLMSHNKGEKVLSMIVRNIHQRAEVLIANSELLELQITKPKMINKAV